MNTSSRFCRLGLCLITIRWASQAVVLVGLNPLMRKASLSPSPTASKTTKVSSKCLKKFTGLRALSVPSIFKSFMGLPAACPPSAIVDSAETSLVPVKFVRRSCRVRAKLGSSRILGPKANGMPAQSVALVYLSTFTPAISSMLFVQL